MKHSERSNFKLQTPIFREAPSTKFQKASDACLAAEGCSLRFLWSLKFVAWSFAVLALSLLTVPASAQAQNTSLPAALTNSPAYQAQMWAWKQRAMPLGYVPVGARDRALNQISQIQSQATRNGPAGPALTGNSWISVGPAPIQN